MDLVPIKGRGASHNPRNRFEKLEYQPDPEPVDPDEPSPRTVLFRDSSRTIIARNNSPDVPFEASLNPYRGCEHGCVYCADGETPIMMADGPVRPLAQLQPGDAVYGTVRRGFSRRYVRTLVLAHWETRKPAYRVTLEDGTQLTASGDHRFLTHRGWKFVTGTEQGAGRRPHLTTSDTLVGIGRRAIGRKRDIEGLALKNAARLGVVSIEPVGTMTLFDITTGTGDFIANGVVSHNCYARPFHEYLGFSAGLDFETKILVKEDAPELLRRELSSPRWTPQAIAISGVTDPYQPVERRLRITRGCLEVLAEFRNPLGIITKNHLVTRDIDILADLARHDAASVMLSVTTLDNRLQHVMEPRTSIPARRLAAVEALARAGIPVGVMVAPIVPGLTDHELPEILEAAAKAGATAAGYVLLRLPHGVAPLFETWLGQHFPDRKDKVLNRIRDIRGGGLYDPRFGLRQKGQGVFAEQVAQMFAVTRARLGLNRERRELSTASFRRPAGGGGQLSLFDGG